jgi:hypothetical protein
MTEASRVLALAEAGAKKKSKVARGSHRFAPGVEWEVLQADAVVLLGLTSALRYVPLSWFRTHLTHVHWQRVVYGLSPVHVIISFTCCS